jgi:hypothetical protein
LIAIVLSALISAWLFSGILSVGIALRTPPDPEGAPVVEPMTLERWVMWAWASLGLILLGPFGLGAAIEKRDERLKKIATYKKGKGTA